MCRAADSALIAAAVSEMAFMASEAQYAKHGRSKKGAAKKNDEVSSGSSLINN